MTKTGNKKLVTRGAKPNMNTVVLIPSNSRELKRLIELKDKTKLNEHP